MAKQYSSLGDWFEYLNADCDYEQWSQYLIKRLKDMGVANGASGVDIGCGNGTFTRALYKAGYSVCGVDLSCEMLSKAKQLALSNGVRCEFLLGDITKLKLNHKCDFAVAINDCINYISGVNLKTAFSKVRQNLKKGGVFIFDISTKYKLERVLGDNLFAEDREQLTYLWFNHFDGEKVTMDLTFFIKSPDGKYTRTDETHVQYAHGECDVVSALKESGFDVVSVEGHLGEKIHPDEEKAQIGENKTHLDEEKTQVGEEKTQVGEDRTQRINFICRCI